MSTQTQDAGQQEVMDMGTKPVPEHQWLQNLVGEWRATSEMTMGPDQPTHKSEGTISMKSVGGLWAFGEGQLTMPGGAAMTLYFALGYDVSFKEYRGCWLASMSSHLWQYVGELSADGKTMTLNCTGPSMSKDGETANYRDVINLLNKNHWTLTSSSQEASGEWREGMKAHYMRD